MKCEQKRNECVFYRDGFCDILRDTRFNKPCPFFKKGQKEIVRDYYFAEHQGVFRNIIGYDNRYYVSEYGEVVNAQGRTISQHLDHGGEYVVTLHKDKYSKRSETRVKILVADAFIPGTGIVRHIDGNITNNAVYNLRRGKADGKEEN